MPRKKHTSEQIICKLREAERGGRSVTSRNGALREGGLRP